MDEIAKLRLGDYMDDNDVLNLILNGEEFDKQNPNLLCHIIGDLFTRNPATQKTHVHLWKQVDNYFKELLSEDVTWELANQKDGGDN